MSHDPLPPFVLKDGETFAMLDGRGEIHPATHPDSGLFHRGTRHLSRLQLLVAHRPPTVLSATERGEIGLHVSHLSNGDAGDAAPSRGSLHLERSTLVCGGACLQQLSFTSFEPLPLRLPLLLRLDADFRDIFEVRGISRTRRGEVESQAVAGGLLFTYAGLDGELRRTLMQIGGAPLERGSHQVAIELELEPRRTRRLCLVIDCHPEGEGASASPEERFDQALATSLHRYEDARRLAARVDTDNPALNSWIRRSASDVHLLASPVAGGLYPYAGVPWFSCPFGRDGLITARQMLLVEPRLARGVLGYLAEHQARSHDPSRDAEPGKVLHEARLGEMAALAEVPFGQYYGSVDATPLFVMLAGDYFERSADQAFVRELLPALEAAIAWIQAAEARAADGFLRYLCAAHGGLRNQGWKDSDDAVHHADGRLAIGSIALCEVQAYAYGARRAMARILRGFGRHGAAEALREEAEQVQQRFHAAFWCESIGTYALALDGEGQPCAVRTSNAGHCLLTGIAPPAAAASVARQLMAPSSFNGWGVRSLDERELRYNPMSYHNGSVWPHDNGLIALGLARYGHTAATTQLFMGLFDTARMMPMFRLPELFCGFPRREDEEPTHYPVACSPQAWASGSVFAVLEALTGMSIGRHPRSGRVRVRFQQPALPAVINRLEVSGLRLGEEEIDLQLNRSEGDVGVLVRRRTAGVDVEIRK